MDPRPKKCQAIQDNGTNLYATLNNQSIYASIALLLNAIIISIVVMLSAKIMRVIMLSIAMLNAIEKTFT